ncbi:RDD family protein [Leucothrix pacifica]|uniref:Uncharacterized protein n=1 Tax=Leucothrix pacifica TaxID=1247513 RepID=A0A317CQ99_9GAMM|nr:RDD family protein [Leucothrix pacifica]PWR00378.1 hypothetical protein DKW60_02160 [Leucothrix pacifica]
MNCWEILGIEPDSDKKTIKIAYAKLLKQCRPDEDPDGFQQLHRAYKNALMWGPVEFVKDDTPWMTEEGKPTQQTEPETEIDVAKNGIPKDSIAKDDAFGLEGAQIAEASESFVLEASDTDNADAWLLEEVPTLSEEDQALLAEISQQEESFGKDWESLYTQVNAIIKSIKQANDIDSWRFIESLPSMRDLEFRKATADKVFEVIAEVNQSSLQSKNLFIKRPVINYLNGLFHWDKKWQQYDYQYNRSMLDAVFPYLEEADRPIKGGKQKRELYYYRRAMAFSIDMIVLILVAMFVDSIAANWGADEESFTAIFWWILLYVLIIIPVQESSRHQGTLGKRIIGLEVISRRGDRINFIHATWRSVVTTFCCMAFKLVLWINLILSWWRSELLQDTLTRSYVRLKPRR